MTWICRALLVSAFLQPLGAVAQVVPPPTPPPTQPPAGVRTFPLSAARDSAAQDSISGVKKPLVDWPRGDSLTLLIAARPGRSATRLLGDSLTVDAPSGRITLYGKPAAISRDSSTIVGDTIIYNDTLDLLQVRGEVIKLRDPQRNVGGDDVEARGVMSYDLATGVAHVHEVRTATVEDGERYLLRAREAAIAPDSVSGRYAMYGHVGSITTCDDPNPHYHITIGTFKMISGRFVVGSPAVMYIADVPVLILPFMINDLRAGRRSGLLTPRLGFSDIVRNSSSYRRQIENFGFYWAMSDYMDSRFWLDWRSGASAQAGDPGWMTFSGELNYKWLDRFLSGRLALGHSRQSDGRTNTKFSLSHQQEFSMTRRLSAELNYVTSTAVQQRQELIPTQQLQTIRSRLNYSQSLGPFQISAGGARTQYPGQEQEDQTFPTLSVSSKPITLLGALSVTPNLSFNNSQRFNFERGGPLSYRYFTRADGTIDSTRVLGDSRNTSASFDLPLSIGRFRWSNSFNISDVEDNYPQAFLVRDVADTSISETRVYQRTYRTDIDWRTNISLPATFLPRTLNVTPSFGITNVHPSSYWVRSERSGGRFVSQAKRPQFGLGIAPTFYGLFPMGFGPFSHIRHSISFQMGYSYSPRADVSDEFLQAIGATRQGYLGSLPQSQLSLGMNHVFEGKLRSDTSASQPGTKVRLLTLNLSALAWDFERAKATGRTGLATDNFGINARSDLLPGLDFSADYSLFQGSLVSDSARFKPFLTGIRSSFSVSKRNNPFAALLALITGKPQQSQQDAPAAPPAQIPAVPLQGDPLSGSAVGGQARDLAQSGGAFSEFSARIEYTLSRQRPPSGDVILIENNAATRCQIYANNPLLFDQCVREAEALASADPNAAYHPPGGAFIRQPARSSLALSLNTPLTPKWSASWITSYDFEVGDFASHMVNLNRDMHDWNASISFTQSPYGSFMFSFLISLKAQPDIKFDYRDANYRGSGRN